MFKYIVISLIISLHHFTSGAILKEDISEKYNSKSRQDMLEYRHKREVGNPSKQSTLAFVFDTTGSMSDELNQVKRQASTILDTMLKDKNSPINNFVLAPFNDPGVGPITITKNPNKLRNALNNIVVNGGDDCEEMSMSGIKKALEISSPNSFIYVFTDATAKDYNMIDEVLGLIHKKKSEVVLFLTGNCTGRPVAEYDAYEKIARTSLGGSFSLNKMEINQILKYIMMKLDSEKVNIDYAVKPSGHNIPYKVAVDGTVKEMIAQVKGPSVELEIINPSGAKVTKTNGLVEIVNLPDLKIDKILNPKEGQWTIKTGSSGRHEMKISGKSDVSFKLHFTSEVIDLRESLDEPLKNTANEINILQTGGQGVNMTEIELIDSVTGEITFVMKLHQTQTDSNIKYYKTESFRPPDETFNIAVIGIDDRGNTVRRIIGSGIDSVTSEKGKNIDKNYSNLMDGVHIIM